MSNPDIKHELLINVLREIHANLSVINDILLTPGVADKRYLNYRLEDIATVCLAYTGGRMISGKAMTKKGPN